MSIEVAMTFEVAKHQPAPMAWTCIVDGEAWPCEAAKLYFRTLFAGHQTALAVLMTGFLTGAVYDLFGSATPVELHQRFVEWTRYADHLS